MMNNLNEKQSFEKKTSTGLVPIDFRIASKILFLIGLAIIGLKVVGSSTGWLTLPDFVLYVGIALLILSLYIFKASPKE